MTRLLQLIAGLPRYDIHAPEGVHWRVHDLANANRSACCESAKRNASPTLGEPVAARMISARWMLLSIPMKYGR